MKPALVVLAGLVLCCSGAESVLSGSDDFNDDIRDTDKWLIWELGDSLLHETNSRLEFTSTGTGYEQDAWLWDYNTGSYSQNWSVILDVRNAASPPVSPQPLALGLFVANSTDHGDIFGISLSAQASNRWVSSGWWINDVNYWPTLGTSHLVATNAARLRLSFDSSTKLLSTAYDIGIGFTALTTFDTGNWALNSNDTFTVAINGQSYNYAVTSGQVYADNFIIVPPGSGGSDTHYVDLASSLPTAPYTSWATAATNIQDAVDVSVDGETVLVADGHYILSSEILVTNAIKVQSVNGPEVTVINGNGFTRCLYLGDTNCLISGFTVTNGYTAYGTHFSDGYGGGVWGDSVMPIITNCIITGNFSIYGGGVSGGTAIDCVIEDNIAIEYGGGIEWGTAVDCIIRSNAATYGGGMAYGAVIDCMITGNTAFIAGGGTIGIPWGESQSIRGSAEHCIITGNASEYGGGACSNSLISCILSDNLSFEDGGGMYKGSATNCLIIGNTAGNDGGGAHYSLLINCTVSDNLSINNGGGMSAGTGMSGGGIAINSVIYYNAALNNGADWSGDGAIFHCCSTAGWAAFTAGCFTNAPLFVDRTNGNYRLLAGSPCINAGATNNAYVAYGADLDGYPRFIDGTVDMGAYEYGFHGCFITNFVVTKSQTILEWTAFPLWEADVRWTTNLTNGFLALETGLDYPMHSYTDTVHSGESTGFYEVEVRMK